MSRIALVLSALSLLAAACGGASAGGQSPASGPRVVVAAYPLAWLVEQIAADADVVVLAGGGRDPHGIELAPRERQALVDADVVVHLGEVGFQPQVEEAVPRARGQVVAVSDVLGPDAMLPAEGGRLDPHVWFDPALMARLAPPVAAALAEADPQGARRYRAEAERVALELRALGADVAARLRDCRHRDVIVSHEAYAYLLRPHGLSQHGISGAAEHSAASPQRIAELAAEISDKGIPAVLTEPVEGRTDAEAVAREAGVELLEIFSLDIVDERQAERGYPALLREQADAVARAARCR